VHDAFLPYKSHPARPRLSICYDGREAFKIVSLGLSSGLLGLVCGARALQRFRAGTSRAPAFACTVLIFSCSGLLATGQPHFFAAFAA
jgi:hypothetical protein